MEENINKWCIFLAIMITVLFIIYINGLSKESNYLIESKPPNIPKDYILTLYNYKLEDIEKVKKFLATLHSPPIPPKFNYNEILI